MEVVITAGHLSVLGYYLFDKVELTCRQGRVNLQTR